MHISNRQKMFSLQKGNKKNNTKERFPYSIAASLHSCDLELFFYTEKERQLLIHSTNTAHRAWKIFNWPQLRKHQQMRGRWT
jgi:hypothetical protein